jgi:hypothetical protein
VCVHYSLVRLSLLHVLQRIILVAGASRALVVVDIVADIIVLHGCNNSVQFDLNFSA